MSPYASLLMASPPAPPGFGTAAFGSGPGQLPRVQRQAPAQSYVVEVSAGGCGLAGRLRERRVQALPLPVSGVPVWVSLPVQAVPTIQVQGCVQGTQVFSVGRCWEGASRRDAGAELSRADRPRDWAAVRAPRVLPSGAPGLCFEGRPFCPGTQPHPPRQLAHPPYHLLRGSQAVMLHLAPG